ncbi:MAG: FAD-binding oxidoreductase [Micavibrio sp.]|nr:FAD-binding oxidoreductase [Micavibrio sp.]
MTLKSMFMKPVDIYDDHPKAQRIIKKTLKICLYTAGFIGFCALLLVSPWEKSGVSVINDVTQLNPIVVDGIATPTTIEDIQKIVREHNGPVSIGGGRYSMGGQTATQAALQIDMRQFNKVLSLDEKAKTVTVQPGVTWRALQEYLDPKNLSVEIMQTYANFTVGGSLSVNVHGRYIGLGPLIMSVRSIKAVLADGSLVEATPKKNSDIFYGVIGGYGGLGVIVEATLDVADNVKVKRSVHRMPVEDYTEYFSKMVRDDKKVIFHNGDIYPPDYDTVNGVSWKETSEDVTITDRLKPVQSHYWAENLMYYIMTETGFGLKFRENYFEPAWYDNKTITWRNHEASYDVHELEPPSRRWSTYVLDEYFVPVEKFDTFLPLMANIFKKHNVNVINVSIRHAKADPGSLLAWARKETFAFVVYYKQGTSDAAKKEVGVWTREMADAAISVGGAWYLPYQPHPTLEQFLKAYPRAPEYFALKKRLDPQYKFRNKLWDHYYFRDDAEKAVKVAIDNTPDYKRPEEQTYLTLPEWYIVFSPDEYAQSLKKAPPSAFPYFGSIAQFWQVYHHVILQTRDGYPVNWGYHAMIAVIGTSYTLELAVKGIYENTVGRITEWVGNRGALTPDMKVETFQQQVAQDYVDFIRLKPWYEYPFYTKFKGLWAVDESPQTSSFRSWERRLVFSAELLFKAFYGWAIGLGTHATYGVAPETIWVVVSNHGQQKLVSLPRYEAFTAAVPKMVKDGTQFIEVAGNKTILMTVIAPRSWQYKDAGSVMYAWPILTEDKLQRVAISLPVEKLHEILPAFDKAGVKVDHIFDY